MTKNFEIVTRLTQIKCEADSLKVREDEGKLFSPNQLAEMLDRPEILTMPLLEFSEPEQKLCAAGSLMAGFLKWSTQIEVRGNETKALEVWELGKWSPFLYPVKACR